jgi:hypothetical protein
MYLIDTDILIYNLKNHEQVRENFRQNASFPKAIVNTGLFFPDFTGLRFPLFHVN